jgi:hypothetical protein
MRQHMVGKAFNYLCAAGVWFGHYSTVPQKPRGGNIWQALSGTNLLRPLRPKAAQQTGRCWQSSLASQETPHFLHDIAPKFSAPTSG